MQLYLFAHLPDDVLLRDLAALVARDRATTALLIAHLAEVDDRRLYRPAGYPSMYAYCVSALHLGEDAAFKRIRAARVARKFPAIFPALAEGRLTLSTVILLAPVLLEPCTTEELADELVRKAAHKTRSEVELLLAAQFPKPDVPTSLEPIPMLGIAPQTSSQIFTGGQMPVGRFAELGPPSGLLSPGSVAPAPETSGLPVPAPARWSSQAQPRLTPLAPERFALQLTISQETHDKLRRVQDLVSFQASGDVAAVIDLALDTLIRKLEKQKIGAADRPAAERPVTGVRYVPRRVRRAVWKRDGGQCTFVAIDGHRCPARRFLEFDHIDPVGRGGEATIDSIRLRCRAHNQYEAELTYGAEFMRKSREAAPRTGPGASSVAEES